MGRHWNKKKTIFCFSRHSLLQILLLCCGIAVMAVLSAVVDWAQKTGLLYQNIIENITATFTGLGNNPPFYKVKSSDCTQSPFFFFFMELFLILHLVPKHPIISMAINMEVIRQSERHLESWYLLFIFFYQDSRPTVSTLFADLWLLSVWTLMCQTQRQTFWNGKRA